MDRGRWASEVIDRVHFDVEREADVVAHELEIEVGQQVLDIAAAAGEEVVDAKDLMTRRYQSVAEMRAEKPGATCHQYAFAVKICQRHLTGI
jgi:hypothetical protein